MRRKIRRCDWQDQVGVGCRSELRFSDGRRWGGHRGGRGWRFWSGRAGRWTMNGRGNLRDTWRSTGRGTWRWSQPGGPLGRSSSRICAFRFCRRAGCGGDSAVGRAGGRSHFQLHGILAGVVFRQYRRWQAFLAETLAGMGVLLVQKRDKILFRAGVRIGECLQSAPTDPPQTCRDQRDSECDSFLSDGDGHGETVAGDRCVVSAEPEKPPDILPVEELPRELRVATFQKIRAGFRTRQTAGENRRSIPAWPGSSRGSSRKTA